MDHRSPLKTSLKRGALVAAANWQVVLVQFLAESAFKLLLAVPIVGGAFLVAVVVGADVVELLRGDARDILSTIAGALAAHPAALAAFTAAFLVVLLGGSALMFLTKGGTVAVLVAADRHAGSIEQPPLRLSTLQRGGRFTLERFIGGCGALFRRYLALGLCLIAVYGLSGAGYVAVVFGGYRLLGDRPLLLGWTLIAALASSALVVWITIVNLLYLLIQIVVATDGVGLREAIRRVVGFLRADLKDLAGIFGIVLVLVALATAASILATAALGFIAFVPLVGLAVLPIQLAAWLLRGLIFQYLGLTALGAYLTLYRGSAAGSGQTSSWPEGVTQSGPRTIGRTA